MTSSPYIGSCSGCNCNYLKLDGCSVGMDILCSDKTGTLTLNKLTVEQASVQPFGNFSKEDVLKYAALSAQKDSEEAIDVVSSCGISLCPTLFVISALSYFP